MTFYRATHPVRDTLESVTRGLNKIRYELEVVRDVDEAMRLVRTLETDATFLSQQIVVVDKFAVTPPDGPSPSHGEAARPKHKSILRTGLIAAYALLFVAGAAFVLTLEHGDRAFAAVAVMMD